MSKAEKISIARPPEMAVELAGVRRLVREGIESGPGIDADVVFAHLRAKYAGPTEE
jgi:hypothetical protein